MTTTIRILIGLLIIAPVTTSSAIDRRSPANRVTYVGQETDLTISADTLLRRADALHQKRDYVAALATYTEAYEAAGKEFNKPVQTEALAMMARMNLVLGELESGRALLDKAADLADQSDPLGWSRYLSVRGRYEWKEDSLARSRKTFSDLFEFCRANALPGRAVDAANMLSIVHTAPNDQIEWLRQGIEIAEANQEERWLGPLYNNLATTYFEMNEFDSALGGYLTAREYHWRHSGEVAKLFADYHVGMTYRRLNDYDSAAAWLRPTIAWAERLGNHGAYGQACEDLGEVLLAQGNRDAGLNLLHTALAAYREAGYEERRPDIWEAITSRLAQVEAGE